MRYYKKGQGVIATIGRLELQELTLEEYQLELERLKARAKRQAQRGARTRALTWEEVGLMLITQKINTLEVDDALALRMAAFYPEWATERDYEQGYKVRYAGGLWRCLQTHRSQADWTPEATASLWERINETYSGTLEDPIPYAGNMALVAGLYYIQEEVLYRCFRDTQIAVHHPLSQLVGLYVEVV